MNLKECIEQRLIRKDKPDRKKAELALKMADERLIDAEIALDGEIASAVIILSYSCIFHASRALLFKDGFVEKSHFCLFLFVKEKYIESGKIPRKFSFLLKNAKEERHEVLYGLERKETLNDAKEIMANAKEYLEIVEKIVKE